MSSVISIHPQPQHPESTKYEIFLTVRRGGISYHQDNLLLSFEAGNSLLYLLMSLSVHSLERESGFLLSKEKLNPTLSSVTI